MSPQRIQATGRRPANSGVVPLCFAALLLVAGSPKTLGQATVKTIGGGPVTAGGPSAGYQDGDNTFSQFNTPLGLALDGAGNLFIADSENNAVRKLRLSDLRVTTVIPRLGEANPLKQPVAVAFDKATNLYAASQGFGVVHKFDPFGNLRLTFGSLVKPTAIAIDSNTNLYVAELGGNVKKFDANGVSTATNSIPGALPQLRGLAILENGSLAVSDEAVNGIWIINSASGTKTLLAGGKGAGFADGPSDFAKFNQPQQLAKGPNGTLIVADRANHRVRAVACDGTVTTIYGIDPVFWSSDFPGWADGSVDFAEAHDPMGVAVSSDGLLFTTEIFYHIVRQTSGVNYPSAECAGGGTGGGTNNLVATPLLTPSSGYYPMGTNVTVTSSSQISGFGPDTRIFYTTDGKEPTTNSLPVTNKAGGDYVIFWRDGLRDLTSLKVKAFNGTNASVSASGQVAFTNQVGFASDVYAGIGATAIIPVVANLKSGDVLRSLQFVVEIIRTKSVTGASRDAPRITNSVAALQMSADDFVPLKVASTNKLDATSEESADKSRVKLPIAYLATNAVFNAEAFATVALLAVPVPPDALEGDRYLLQVTSPSGTSDGFQNRVEVVPMSPRVLFVTNISYLVGDTSLGRWYNIGSGGSDSLREFGDGILDNSDVNNAVYASFGVRIPFKFSDAFDAMDAYPDDSGGTHGGDGKIRFLDWQVILRRSLKLDPENRIRTRTTGGSIVSTNVTQSPLLAAESLSSAPSGAVWVRQVTLGAKPVENVNSPSTVRVPIYATVIPGKNISGFQFRAVVTPQGDTPALREAVQFEAAAGLPTPSVFAGFPSNEVALAWNAFNPPLQGSNVVGSLVFNVPASLGPGHSYLVHFAPEAASGASANPTTDLEIETVPAYVWVAGPATQPPEIISDEWKIHFFGSLTNAFAQSQADPDNDGFSNVQEYLAGTDPTDPASQLRLISSAGGAGNEIKLQWLSAPGKTYSLEHSATLVHPSWSAVATNILGTGNLLEVTVTNADHNPDLYRLRLGP